MKTQDRLLVHLRIACLIVFVAMIAGCSQARVSKGVFAGRAALILNNGSVEAVIVPELGGRLMSLRSIDGENVLWVNRSPEPDGRGFVNWGGDKTYLGPHPTWNEFSVTLWPPKREWDNDRWEARVVGNVVELTGPIWEGFGVEIARTFSFFGKRTIEIRHTLTKIQGPPVTVSAWQVAQVRPPESISIPRSTGAGAKFIVLGRSPPEQEWSKPGGDMMVLSPTFKHSYKIGVHAEVPALSASICGNRLTLAAAQTVDPFDDPDMAAPVEVYVGPGDDPYAELELQSKPVSMSIGQVITFVTRFTLERP